MNLRFYGLSLVWTILLGLILLGINFPALSQGSDFSPKFSFQYFLGFGLLAFSICSSLKKQMKSNNFRRNAFALSAGITLLILVGIEIFAMNLYPERSVQFFWDFCGLIGIGIGLSAFRLLYDSCC